MEKFEILSRVFQSALQYFSPDRDELGEVFDFLIQVASLCEASRHPTSKETMWSQNNQNAAHTSKEVPLPEVVTAFQGG